MMSHIVRWPKTLKSSLIGRNPLKRAFSLNYHNDNAELSASSRHEQPINHPHELYTVRVAQTYDIPAIKAANRANLPENYSPEFFSRHLQLWPALSLIAECDGVLIGYALGRVELVAQPAPTGTSVPYPCVRLVRPHRQPVGHVTSVAVNDDFRGFGVGKALMTAFMHPIHGETVNMAVMHLIRKVYVLDTPWIRTVLRALVDSSDCISGSIPSDKTTTVSPKVSTSLVSSNSVSSAWMAISADPRILKSYIVNGISLSARQVIAPGSTNLYNILINNAIILQKIYSVLNDDIDEYRDNHVNNGLIDENDEETPEALQHSRLY